MPVRNRVVAPPAVYWYRNSAGVRTLLINSTFCNDAGSVSSLIASLPRLEAHDVVDVALAFVAPARHHVHARRHLARVARVDRVQQRRVGAVDADERPREWPLDRILRMRPGHPRPRRHDSAGT